MKSFFHFLELVFQEMNSKMNEPVFTDTKIYWKVLREENKITMSCLFQLMFEFRNPNSNINLEDRDPYDAVYEEFGGNAFYFNLPKEFDEYMDYQIEEQLEWWNREALEDFVKLVEKKICK